jgi:hypothetical protein
MFTPGEPTASIIHERIIFFSDILASYRGIELVTWGFRCQN